MQPALFVSLEVSAARCLAGPARQRAQTLMLSMPAQTPALEAFAARGLILGLAACRPSEAASEAAAAPRVRRSRQPGDLEPVQRSRQPGDPEHERKTKSMYSKLGGKAAVDAAVLEL